MRRRFIKNALANLGRGSTGAIAAVLLPPVLVRHMAPASYAVWVLVLQTAAYAGYLNFGLQSAIGRYVAYANEKKDFEQRDSVFSTAVVGLVCAAVISIICLVAAIVAAPAIFPKVPLPLIPQMRWALLIVGFAMAVELPASACGAVFVGVERYEIPAMAGGAARLLSSLGVIAAALAGRSLVVMATVIALTNLLSYLAQYLALRRMLPDVRFQKDLVRRSTAHELYGYCLGLTVMSFAMLLVTGFDLVMVGRFEFSAVTPYSTAASMITFISGLLYAVIGVMMPHAAALYARDKAVEIGQLVVSSTRISVLLLILSGLPLFIYAGPIIRLWIGERFVVAGRPLLAILIIANIIRLVGAPYSIIMISAGQQRLIKVSPLCEGFSNFVSSLVLGLLWGAIGVALGTLIGSVVGLASHLWYSMPRTNNVMRFSRRSFVVSGVIYPALWTFPLLATAAASCWGGEIHPLVFASSALASLMGAALLLLRYPHGLGFRRV